MDYNQTELERITGKLQNKYIGIEPMLLIASIALLIIYYYVFSSLGNNEDGITSTLKVFSENALWLFFIILLLLNGISYIFGIDLIKTIKGMLGLNKKSSNIGSAQDKDDNIKIMLKEQVFHLPENKFTFDNAKAICNAYDARLATYDEVSEAYNKGADWCSYGWSDAQMALYPTQKEKWEKLQKMPEHEKDCGRTGINGGYMDDATLQFGVNCYGNKPSVTPDEARRMRDKPAYIKNMKEAEFDKTVDTWRSQLSQIEIAPFNHDNWSVL